MLPLHLSVCLKGKTKKDICLYEVEVGYWIKRW